MMMDMSDGDFDYFSGGFLISLSPPWSRRSKLTPTARTEATAIHGSTASSSIYQPATIYMISYRDIARRYRAFYQAFDIS
jgi:hypothetical protein